MYLADRAPQLERFQRYLAGFPGLPRNVRLTGLRGVGKTVLLRLRPGWWKIVGERSNRARAPLAFGQRSQEVRQNARVAEAAGWIVVGRECNQHMARSAFDLLGSFTISLAGVTLAVQ